MNTAELLTAALLKFIDKNHMMEPNALLRGIDRFIHAIETTQPGCSASADTCPAQTRPAQTCPAPADTAKPTSPIPTQLDACIAIMKQTEAVAFPQRDAIIDRMRRECATRHSFTAMGNAFASAGQTPSELEVCALVIKKDHRINISDKSPLIERMRHHCEMLCVLNQLKFTPCA